MINPTEFLGPADRAISELYAENISPELLPPISGEFSRDIVVSIVKPMLTDLALAQTAFRREQDQNPDVYSSNIGTHLQAMNTQAVGVARVLNVLAPITMRLCEFRPDIYGPDGWKKQEADNLVTWDMWLNYNAVAIAYAAMSSAPETI